MIVTQAHLVCAADEMEHTSDKDECARQCRDARIPVFTLGNGDDAFGKCYGEVMIVTQAYFDHCFSVQWSMPKQASLSAVNAIVRKAKRMNIVATTVIGYDVKFDPV